MDRQSYFFMNTAHSIQVIKILHTYLRIFLDVDFKFFTMQIVNMELYLKKNSVYTSAVVFLFRRTVPEYNVDREWPMCEHVNGLN